jgi:hypothetical protein
LKLDNKHVSRQQVQLVLHFGTGVASLMALGTNPTTLLRANGGELLLDVNQLYPLGHGDTVCLWRSECRFRFIVTLIAGLAPPVPPALDAATASAGTADDTDSVDRSMKSVSLDVDGDEDVASTRTVDASESETSAHKLPQSLSSSRSRRPSRLNGSSGHSSRRESFDTGAFPLLTDEHLDAFNGWQRVLTDGGFGVDQSVSIARLLAVGGLREDAITDEDSLDHDQLIRLGVRSAQDRMRVLAIVDGRRKPALPTPLEDASDWAVNVLHGALLRRLEAQAREIGSLRTQLAEMRRKNERLEQKLTSSKRRGAAGEKDSSDEPPNTSADSIPDAVSEPGSLRSSAPALAAMRDLSSPLGSPMRTATSSSALPSGATPLSPRSSPQLVRATSGKAPAVTTVAAAATAAAAAAAADDGDATDDDEEGRADQRHHVIAEILQTERDYVRDLRWVLDQYVEPIKAASMLNERDQQHLFSNLASLLHLHEEILKMLEEKASTAAGSDPAVGQTFVRISAYLKVYATYVIDQDGMRDFIAAKFAESPEFAAHCLAVKAMPASRSLDLEAFLIKPVQRVCKYPLLIDQLLKATPKAHPDRALLSDALESVRGVAAHVNESKRSVAMIARVAQISKNISGLPRNFELAVASRKFLHEGALSLLGAAESLTSSPSITRKQQKANASQAVYCFLFNDALIECKMNKAKFVVRQVLMFDGDLIGEQVPQSIEPNAFQLIRMQNGQRQTFLYSCQSNDEAETWVTQLGKVIKFNLLVRKSQTLRKVDRTISSGLLRKMF